MIHSILQNLVMSEMGAEFIEAAPYQPILVETPSVDDQVCLVILKEFFSVFLELFHNNMLFQVKLSSIATVNIATLRNSYHCIELIVRRDPIVDGLFLLLNDRFGNQSAIVSCAQRWATCSDGKRLKLFIRADANRVLSKLCVLSRGILQDLACMTEIPLARLEFESMCRAKANKDNGSLGVELCFKILPADYGFQVVSKARRRLEQFLSNDFNCHTENGHVHSIPNSTLDYNPATLTHGPTVSSMIILPDPDILFSKKQMAAASRTEYLIDPPNLYMSYHQGPEDEHALLWPTIPTPTDIVDKLVDVVQAFNSREENPKWTKAKYLALVTGMYIGPACHVSNLKDPTVIMIRGILGDILHVVCAPANMRSLLAQIHQASNHLNKASTSFSTAAEGLVLRLTGSSILFV
jgi:hypothetical protein